MFARRAAYEICCLVRPGIPCQAERYLKRYEDKDGMLEDYHQVVLEGIERMRGMNSNTMHFRRTS